MTHYSNQVEEREDALERSDRAARAGTPTLDDQGRFFLATPYGPSAPIDLRELCVLMNDKYLFELKEKIDAELTRRAMLTGPIVRSGVEL